MADFVEFDLGKQVPVVAKAQVLVVGGGPGGLGAAIAAARQGADVLLVERCGGLGGAANNAEITPFMPSHHKVMVDGQERLEPWDGPVYIQWMDRMHHYLNPALKEICLDAEYMTHKARSISKDLASLAAEDLCLEAGVRLLFRHTLVGVIKEERRIRYAVFHSKSGFTAIEAQMFIDSTGDGDLAAVAGCEFEYGDEVKHLCQPMSLCFKLSNVDWQRMPPSDELNKLYREAKERGEINCPRLDVLKFSHFDNDVVHFNTTRVNGLSAISGEELSKAEMEGRRQLRQIFLWLRRCIPGFEEAELRSMGSEIGVRESRRIKGLAHVGREDFMAARKFPDAILRCNYPIDIHSTTGADTEIVTMAPGTYYEMPYGCIVPPSVDNLLVGSRCVSVDHAFHSSCRVMPPVISIGQAAGTAAVMAINGNTIPAKLDGQAVREALVRFGAKL